MKRWKSLSNEEKKKWNDKAAGGESQDSDDKKRKRENTENDENENVNATANTKTAKKLKAGGDNSVSSKLAGFAYSKS